MRSERAQVLKKTDPNNELRGQDAPVDLSLLSHAIGQ